MYTIYMIVLEEKTKQNQVNWLFEDGEFSTTMDCVVSMVEFLVSSYGDIEVVKLWVVNLEVWSINWIMDNVVHGF